MKRLILSISLLAVVAITTAQDEKFQQAMQQNITLLDSAKTIEDLTSVASAFERIGNAETTKWQPYYYAALPIFLLVLKMRKLTEMHLQIKQMDLFLKPFLYNPKTLHGRA